MRELTLRTYPYIMKRWDRSVYFSTPNWVLTTETVKITEFLGLASAASFLATVVYVFGYSWTLGLNLLVYLEPSDYFRVALEWLPITLGIMFGGILVHETLRRVEGGATEKELAASSPFPRFTRSFRDISRNIPPLVMLALAIFATLSALLQHRDWWWTWATWAGAAPMLWVSLIDWYSNVPELGQGWTRPTSMIIKYGPAFLLFVLFIGLSDGELETRRFLKPPHVRIAVGTTPSAIEGNLLFSLHSHIILRDSHGNLVTVPQGQVLIIEHLTDKN